MPIIHKLLWDIYSIKRLLQFVAQNKHFKRLNLWTNEFVMGIFLMLIVQSIVKIMS